MLPRNRRSSLNRPLLLAELKSDPVYKWASTHISMVEELKAGFTLAGTVRLATMFQLGPDTMT